ncbi:pyridoxal-phosphate dependent enzyme [Microbacterium sp.]|uniref:pyridoxal-phosphate dependent enzyme n=1 Tax=Microbacterium sp. TaxID=51671 RepID=UPI003C779FCC
MADHTTRTYDSILELLPDADNPTPIVRLNKVTGFEHAQVYAKLEWYNPFGAVKDRVAANLVRAAEERGEELENLVEPTSGNTGIGLAMIANAKGYGFSATLSKDVPLEKRAALRIFGTDLVELDDDLCPLPGQPEGAMQRAEELAERPGWRELNQYQNPDNPDAHFRTTGPEIWRQTGGSITHFAASLGTCGTITGTGRYLKQQNPDVKVIGVHPTEGHDIPGVRSRRALGVTEFFLPDEYDAVVEVADADAYHLAKRLNQEESIIAGPSSALALAGALREIPDEPGVVAVVIFPDNVFKYTSSFQRHLPELFPADTLPEPQAVAPANPFAGHLEAAFEFAKHGPDVVDAGTAAAQFDDGAVLIDVRGPAELERARIAGAVNVPLPELSQGRTDGLPTDKDAPVLTLCAAGTRSLYALLLLKAQGYRNVKSVDGGIAAWAAAGLPTEQRSTAGVG